MRGLTWPSAGIRGLLQARMSGVKHGVHVDSAAHPAGQVRMARPQRPSYHHASLSFRLRACGATWTALHLFRKKIRSPIEKDILQAKSVPEGATSSPTFAVQARCNMESLESCCRLTCAILVWHLGKRAQD